MLLSTAVVAVVTGVVVALVAVDVAVVDDVSVAVIDFNRQKSCFHKESIFQILPKFDKKRSNS